MSPKDYIVLDTTCLVSAFIYPFGKPSQAVRLARSRYETVVSIQTSGELSRVLADAKFDRYDPTRERLELLKLYRESSSIHEQIYEIKACRDPNDDMFLSLALSCGALIIMSSDGALQEMKHFHGIQIWSPAQFLERELARE